MLKYCIDKWDVNQVHLQAALTNKIASDNSLTYYDLVSMIIEHVLNYRATEDEPIWDTEPHEVCDGDYQGTLLFLIVRETKTHFPSSCDYLMTYVNYGSCSYCDALEYALYNSDDPVSDLMTLAMHIIQHMIHPYSDDSFLDAKV